MLELQANTEVKVRIGPFVDVGDGFTPQVDIGNPDTNLTGVDEAELLKHNGAGTVDILARTWEAITDCDGWYDLTLTTTDTNTEGLLTVVVQDDSDCLPVFCHFMVLAQAAWLSKYTAKDSGYMDVDIKAVGGTATPHTSGKLHVLDDAGDALANEAKQNIIDTVADSIYANVMSILVDYLSHGTWGLSAIRTGVAGVKTDTYNIHNNVLSAISDYLGHGTWGLSEIRAALQLVQTDADQIDANVLSIINDHLSQMKSSLVRWGQIYAINGNAFTSPQLAGLGVDAMPAGWYVYVMQADNAAPEGEYRLLTDYANDGTVSHEAFSVALEVGDRVQLIHPVLYESFNAATEAKQDIIDTNIDTLLVRLSAAKSSYLNELEATHMPADLDTLKTRLSDYRANLLNYLTELGSAHIPADIDTLLSRLTAARATNLNYLTELSSAHIPADVDTLKTYCDILDHATNGLANLKSLIDTLDTVADAVKAKTDLLPSGVPKNVALSNFEFLMVLSTDHITPATGKSITATISKDGGAFAGTTNSVSEISGGVYKISFTQAEMNADVIGLIFSEADCDQRTITMVTST